MLAAIRKTEHDLLPLLARDAGVDGRRRHGHDHRGRVQGRSTARPTTRSTFQFGVDGATARLSDPGAGGTIDVNVLNQRNWIDVTYAAAVERRALRSTSARSPTSRPSSSSPAPASARSRSTPRARRRCVETVGDTVTYRYWLTGVRGTGAITLTYLPGTWAFNARRRRRHDDDRDDRAHRRHAVRRS